MAYVGVGGMQLHYEEHGQRAGPPLVLVHGFTGSASWWRPLRDAFGEHYRLIVPDLRGHARTVNPGGLELMRMPQFGRDLVGMCRALGVERAAFCGHSAGAIALLTLAVEAPALAGPLILANGAHEASPALATWASTLNPETVSESLRAAKQAEHAAQGPDHWRTVLAATAASATLPRADALPDARALPLVQSPALIVSGDRDPFFPVEITAALYRLLPNAEFCVLPSTAHMAPDRRNWFTSFALDFLARHPLT